jgi:hypothetical protein
MTLAAISASSQTMSGGIPILVARNHAHQQRSHHGGRYAENQVDNLIHARQSRNRPANFSAGRRQAPLATPSIIPFPAHSSEAHHHSSAKIGD